MIGLDEGPDEYSLYQVREAAKLLDSSIVITNSGADEIRYYDPCGEFLYVVGSDGYDSGGLKEIWSIWLFQDSVVVVKIGQEPTTLL